MANNKKTYAGNLTFKNARIVFRNFSGKEGTYNRAGDRNFCLIVDPADAPNLEADGWNIKYLKPREEGDAPQPYLPVAVAYSENARPPRIVSITSRGKTNLDEDTVDILDWAELQSVDLIVRPYDWEVNGNTGRKAYLKTLYATLVEDELEQMYADVPDSANAAVNSGGPSFNIDDEE